MLSVMEADLWYLSNQFLYTMTSVQSTLITSYACSIRYFSYIFIRNAVMENTDGVTFANSG